MELVFILVLKAGSGPRDTQFDHFLLGSRNVNQPHHALMNAPALIASIRRGRNSDIACSLITLTTGAIHAGLMMGGSFSLRRSSAPKWVA